MANHHTTEGDVRNLQPHEIKILVENQGKSNMGGKVIRLQSPSHKDLKLQAIINDPKFTAKLIGFPTSDGDCIYELKGDGKTMKVKINYSTFKY